MTTTGGSLTWDEARTLYPGTAEVAYLDSAAVGLISSRVREAMTGVLAEHERSGIAAAPSWRDHADTVRASVARLVGGRADRVAFTQNTTTGLATVTNGVDWREGDNVVVPTGEFPSNFYPWVQLRRRGVEVREVAMTGGRAPVDDVLAALDHRTRVLALSAVQYSSGHRYDLGTLGAACRGSDALLVVDATQAVGALTVDADLLGIDVLAVSAHKWLLGPFGIGFVHLSERAMQRLVPSTVGWLSVEDPFAFDHEPQLAADARRFESGTENSAGIAGLGATVDLLHRLDRQRVEDRVLDRAEHLATLLEEAGMHVHLPEQRSRRSGIVIASSPTGAHQALHERLLSAGVRCSLRATGLRFAPHYFSSDADLHRAADALRAARPSAPPPGDPYVGDPSVRAEWDRRYSDQAQLWSGRPNGALVAEAAGMAPGRVLDVGCGEGADAVWLAGRGWDVTALEVSGVALERAARHAADAGVSIRWVHAGLVEASLPSAPFDLVSAQYPALLRTPDSAAERALLAAVAPGGVLLLVHHAGMDSHEPDDGDFDPADYVWPSMVAALLDDDWVVEVDEVRPRQAPEGGAGAHHAEDVVLRARRLR